MTLLIATSTRGSPLTAPVSFGYCETKCALFHDIPGIEALPPSIGYQTDNIRARNRMAATVLRDFPHVTHVLWWDDDQWPEDRRIVQEMIACGEDLVSAPYTNKRLPVTWVHQQLYPSPPMGEDGLQDVRAVGFGFTMTSRACLEKMSANARRYTDLPNPHKVANIFGMLYDAPVPGVAEEEEMLLSEDYSFCKRWRELGGKVKVYGRAGNIIYHAGGYPWSARDIPGSVE